MFLVSEDEKIVYNNQDEGNLNYLYITDKRLYIYSYPKNTIIDLDNINGLQVEKEKINDNKFWLIVLPIISALFAIAAIAAYPQGLYWMFFSIVLIVVTIFIGRNTKEMTKIDIFVNGSNLHFNFIVRIGEDEKIIKLIFKETEKVKNRTKLPIKPPENTNKK